MIIDRLRNEERVSPDQSSRPAVQGFADTVLDEVRRRIMNKRANGIMSDVQPSAEGRPPLCPIARNPHIANNSAMQVSLNKREQVAQRFPVIPV